MEQSADMVGFTKDEDSDVMIFTTYPETCPPYHVRPFAFKPWCFRQAQKAGYEQILWMDSSHWFVRHPQPVFDWINEHGHYFIRDGWTTGEWCSDIALEPLGITREEAFEMLHLWAGIIGLDLRNDDARWFLDEWEKYSVDDRIFGGPESPSEGFISDYPGVSGHRYDQTAASVLVHRRNLSYQMMGEAFMTTDIKTDREDVCVIACGGVRETDLELIQG